MKLVCHRCDRHWNYKGKGKWIASCPTCKTSITIKNNKDLKNKKKEET